MAVRAHHAVGNGGALVASRPASSAGRALSSLAVHALPRLTSDPTSARTSTPRRTLREVAAQLENADAALAGEDSESKWQWLNPRGTWQNFEARSCAQLERAHANGLAKCLVSTVAGRFDVDLRKMTQRDVSKSVAPDRKVRRNAADGEDTATPAGEPSATVSPPKSTPSSSSRTPALPKSTPSSSSRAPSCPATPTAAAAGNSTARRGSLRNVGSSVVARPARPPSGQRSVTRPEPVAPNTADDESLARSLALAEEEEYARRVARAGRGRGRIHHGLPFSDDTALAFLLAQQGDADAAIAAVVAAESLAAFGGGHPDAADVDRMGYEELLALGERIGYAERSSKPTPWMLRRLPTRTVPQEGRGSGEEEECIICFEEYSPGDELRTLPCLHTFHCKCIDEWLMSDTPAARSCPVCHTAVEFE